MLKSSVIMLILLVAAVMASAQERHNVRVGGVVTAVDDSAKTFTCHWKAGDRIFKTTDKTTYWIGGKQATWADVKVGAEVTVTSRRDVDKGIVADKVEITKPGGTP
jgi:PDZ domain-containing secreted protein